jgi:kinesin family protein 4/21/27
MAVEDHLPAAAQEARQEDSVVVAVNVRPLIDLELAEGCKPCLHVTPGEPQVGP